MEWSLPHPAEFAAALGLGLLGLLMLARRAARSSGARSMALFGLRASSLAVLVLILLGPVRTVETRLPADRPSAVYLIDGSRSMGLGRPATRLDAVDRTIERAEGQVGPGRLPRVDRYRFGDGLAALAPGEPVFALDERSGLVDALERLPSRFGETPPVGVFVFSDGRATDPAGLEAAARGYRKIGVPVHVVPIGDPAVSGDVSIRDLTFPRDAPKGAKVPLRVVVGSRGLDGRRVEVVVRPATGDDVRPLATLPITLDGGDQPAELVIEGDRSRGPLVVEVLPVAGEAVAENNVVPFRVGSKDPKIRVIYMEGSPDPEYAFIRDALVEDPDIECVAMSTDFQSNFRPRLHRVDDPSKGYPATREELLGFDVVICSDIARASFTPEQLEWTVELVAKRGGGFAMVGGHTSFGSGGWDRTSWDGMIPVDMSGDGPGRTSEFYNGSFRVLVPPGAESHPIWRIVDDPAENREILRRMPPFSGTNLTDRLKPAATLLGVSDRPISGPRSAASKPRGNPIFSCQTFGRGRSFAMSTDSTISWGSEFEHHWGEGDNRYFRKFWRNVVRWLAEDSAGVDRRLEVAVDKVLYRPGEPIAVTARAFDESLNPTGRYRLVSRLIRPGPAGESAPPLVGEAPMAPGAGLGDFAASLVVPPSGRLREGNGPAVGPALVEVRALDGEEVVARATVAVQVLDDSEEYRDPRPDRDRLVGLARAAGGSVLDGPDDLARLLDRPEGLDARVVTAKAPTWDTPAILALVFALLAAEWVVRRSRGLA